MDKYYCVHCDSDVRDSELECGGPRHMVYGNEEEEEGISIEEIQSERHGAYVDPMTGKIVRAKALNKPIILGKS